LRPENLIFKVKFLNKFFLKFEIFCQIFAALARHIGAAPMWMYKNRMDAAQLHENLKKFVKFWRRSSSSNAAPSSLRNLTMDVAAATHYAYTAYCILYTKYKLRKF